MIHWNSFGEFLAMGGYAGYVWGALVVTALVLVVEPILVRRHQRQTITRLKRQLRAEERTSPQ